MTYKSVVKEMGISFKIGCPTATAICHLRDGYEAVVRRCNKLQLTNDQQDHLHCFLQYLKKQWIDSKFLKGSFSAFLTRVRTNNRVEG